MAKRRAKYGSKKVTFDGLEFDSKKEMYRYIRLKSMQEEGLISDLRMQVPYEIIPAVYEEDIVQLKTKVKTVTKCVQRATYYLADFVYKDKDGNVVVEDAKGMRTEKYLLKKKMMRAFLGITIKEV
jgi:hypothetical protein